MTALRWIEIILIVLALEGCRSLVSEAPESMNTITTELARRHVDFLASDAMLGRNTPSPQLDSAAEYIASELRSARVQPVRGSYFMKVPLNIISLGDSNALSIRSDGAERTFALKSDFIPFEMTANGEASGRLVFAGYGITAPQYGYDDYKGIDATGKIVVVLRHEPREDDSASVFDGERASPYSSIDRKVEIAVQHGARAVLVVSDPLNHSSVAPRGYPWPSLSRVIPADALPITLGMDEEKKVPVVHVGEEAIGMLFGSVDALREIERQIDSTMAPRSFDLNATCMVKTATHIRDMSSRNVVGMVAGSDSTLGKEVIVVGAHYDHVGYQKNQPAGVDSIFNGADDNASGSAALLSIASAFGRSPIPPKRTVLFIFFAGEEKGLLGSAAYTRAPLFPLGQTRAMLNLDMVGRNAIDSLFIIGGSLSPDLARINAEENEGMGFTLLTTMEKTIIGSDQASFLKKGIPVLFYHSGDHRDYHKVSDNPDRINAAKVARVARLAFKTAWRIANDPGKYNLLATPFFPF